MTQHYNYVKLFFGHFEMHVTIRKIYNQIYLLLLDL